MDKLKKVLGLPQLLPLTVCLIFLISILISIENRPLNATQTPSNITNSSFSLKDFLVVATAVSGGICSAIVSIFSIVKSSEIKEEKIKLLEQKNESQEKKHQDEITKMRTQFQDDYDREKHQKKMNTDFYALVFGEIGDGNMIGIEKVKETDERNEDFETRLNQCQEKFEFSRRSIDELLSVDKKEQEVLKAIVYDAITNSSIGKNENFKDKCKHLYSYLRGWLVCSIRYNTNQLPIEWIQNNALSKTETIEALEQTKKIIQNDENVKKYIKHESSRKLICEYIDILIEKI